MLVLITLVSSLIAATSVSIIEPVDGETYDGDWLPFRVIVENENEVPDSVTYVLNGGAAVQVERLNTDWPTYMQNFQNNGYSVAPGPVDNTVFWMAPVTSGEWHEFPTPVTANGMVYFPEDGAGMGEYLHALNAITGEEIWNHHVGYTDDAVSVVDGRVYSASDSIYCFDAITGEVIWTSSEGDDGGSTPVVDSGRVFCGVQRLSSEPPYFDSSRVVCLDALDGSVIWADTVYGRQCGCMAIRNDTLVMPTCSFEPPGPLYAFNANDGSIIWTNNDAPVGYWDSSPNIVDSNVYICDLWGAARAIDFETGETVWVSETSSRITATPAYHDGRIYYGDDDYQQQPWFFCLDAATGSEIWSASVAGIHGSPGITSEMVYYGESIEYEDSARVIALDLDTGDIAWTFKTACGHSGFQSSPSITDGIMYYPCTDGNLYAFGTGLKYTYKEDYFFADVGSNELIVTSFDNGAAVAADTISFTVTQTGINLEPSRQLWLSASPNPVTSNSSISFELAQPGNVSLEIYDLSGRKIVSLIDQTMVEGEHSVQWNGCCDNGEPISSGLYLCHIESGGVIGTIGLCVLK